ncbi:MAG: carbamoyltransferase N-terminal domain-containing protein, partial [Planctomycetota bacterium]
ALLCDGELLATAREESFSRTLGDSSFPRRAAHDCLRRAGLEARDLDQVVCSGKPLREFERVLATRMRAFPAGAGAFAQSLSSWLGEKLWIRNQAASELELDSPHRVGFVSHLRCHANNAFLTSPFEEAAILVIDEAREWESTLLARGTGTSVESLGTIRHPHSLAASERALARAIGFEGGSAVERLRGAAHSGKASKLLLPYLPSSPQGGFAVSSELLDPNFELCGAEASFEQRCDMAASAQYALELRFLELLHLLHERAPLPRLCLSGAMATNRSLVTAALESGPFEEVFVPQDPTDSGTALGAALQAAQQRTPHAAPRFARAAPPETRPPLSVAGLGAMLDDLEAGKIIAWHRPGSLGVARVWSEASSDNAADKLRAAVQRNDRGLPTRVALPIENFPDYGELSSRCEEKSTSRLLSEARLEVRATRALR